ATKLGFTVQPSTAVAGVAISPAVTVAVQDQFGNTVTTSTANVTVALHGTGQPTLFGTVTRAAVAGIATFNDSSIQTTSTYSLDTSTTAPVVATSSLHAALPTSATKLGFTVQPSTAVAGVAISPSVTVAVQDQYGNTVTSSTASVTVALHGTGQ